MSNSIVFTTPLTVTTVGTGPTVKQNVFNELDQVGLLLGLNRLVGERNALYKQRLMRVFSERANSTYRGLINGITRSLDLKLYDALTITATETSGVFNATNPGVVISEAFVYLYENIITKNIDTKIDRFDRNGSANNITDLVSSINFSNYFTATLSPGVDAYSRSMTLLNQTSVKEVAVENILNSTRFLLKNSNIIKGTIFFSDTIRFATEVSIEGNVNSSGKYWIDYKKGIVQSFSTGSPNSSCRYQYIKSPMICKASPVIIYNLQSQDFKAKMFKQITSDNNQIINGLPTPIGADLINELLTVFPGYWGE